MIFICAASFTVNSFAQTISIKGGVALATYSAISNHEVNRNAPRTNISTFYHAGLVAGANADFGSNKNLFLCMGSEIVRKGAKEKGISAHANGAKSFVFSKLNQLSWSLILKR